MFSDKESVGSSLQLLFIANGKQLPMKVRRLKYKKGTYLNIVSINDLMVSGYLHRPDQAIEERNCYTATSDGWFFFQEKDEEKPPKKIKLYRAVVKRMARNLETRDLEPRYRVTGFAYESIKQARWELGPTFVMFLGDNYIQVELPVEE